MSEGLTDDCNHRSTPVILRREAAPAQQRDFHRRQIVLAHRLPHSFVFHGSLFNFAGQQEVIEPIIIRDERTRPNVAARTPGT